MDREYIIIGPSEVRETSGANLGRPLFQVINIFLLFFSCFAVTKIPEGVGVGLQQNLWASNYQKYKDYNQNNYLGSPPSPPFF